MTDQDRELLELAAKATGKEYGGYCDVRGLLLVHDAGEKSVWNPLTDDGDAFRLAVKLGIDVMHTNIHSPSVHAMANHNVVVTEDSSIAPLAAPRRAITRAAAEIGRSMK